MGQPATTTVSTTDGAHRAGQHPPSGTPQPFLHDLVTCLRAPISVISAVDGQVRGRGASGVYDGDCRVVATWVVRVDGVEPEPVGQVLRGPGEAQFTGVVRHLGDPIPDPTVLLTRHRSVGATGPRDRFVLRSSAQTAVECELAVELMVDLLDMTAVKTGAPSTPVTARSGSDRLVWVSEDRTVTAYGHPAPDDVRPEGAALVWRLAIPPRGSVEVTVEIDTTATRTGTGFRPLGVTGAPPWTRPRVSAGDRRLVQLLERGLDDAQSLLLADPEAPQDTFLAAGSPWFLTLFGRDSLWAARMLLPLGTELARGTLATLARRQGRRVDPSTEEQPGKILHEVRGAPLSIAGDIHLPALYFGTVDATPLWVCLLADAWRWGMPAGEVAALLPACEAALGWLVDHGDSDGDGFLEYVDSTGSGLTNQGWKDSGDSIQWADGRLAAAPLALCEVQGYAYEAAMAGADLLDAFGRPGADRFRAWATRLQERFRAEFWTEDDGGPFPAVALDGQKRRVDSLTSNIGHLLGTGLLDPEESRLVAARLGAPEMDSGFGLRTLTSRSPRYGPLSYHGGSVWPHDTAIAVHGLARAGHGEVAAGLIHGLLEAAVTFDFRLPELFGGTQRTDGDPLLAYPAACRPQAWAATSAVALLRALVGVRPDVPSGRVVVDPLRPVVAGALEVRGLRVGGRELDLAVDAEGRVEVSAPHGLEVDVVGGWATHGIRDAGTGRRTP